MLLIRNSLSFWVSGDWVWKVIPGLVCPIAYQVFTAPVLIAEYKEWNITELYALRNVVTILNTSLCPDALPHLSSPAVAAHYTYLPMALHATCKMTCPSFTQINWLTNREAPSGEQIEGSLAPWWLACVLKGSPYYSEGRLLCRLRVVQGDILYVSSENIFHFHDHILRNSFLVCDAHQPLRNRRTETRVKKIKLLKTFMPTPRGTELWWAKQRWEKKIVSSKATESSFTEEVTS